MCISDAGAVTRVTVIKSTGYPDYDNKIVAAMRLWSYKPHLIDGKPHPICTAVTFIYSQK